MFSYLNISPFLLFPSYFISQSRNSFSIHFDPVYSYSLLITAPSSFLLIYELIHAPQVSLLSFPPFAFFHAFPFAPILVSSSFTAKSRRYSLFPSLCLQRWIPCFPGQLEENFYPPIDGSTCEFSKWREQADFRVATSLVFPFKHKSRPTCRGKHVYRSRGRFH